VKQAFRLSSARGTTATVAVSLLFILSAFISVQAQTASPTPDSFVAQITSANNLNSFAYGISGNGRFVVIESTGNLAPSDPANPTTVEPNNADGNREIFLFDYAQRRLFQITNTKHALKVLTTSATDNTNIEVEVTNNRPVISYDGKWIVFSSNAYVDADASATPKNFNGNNFKDALKADGNQELFMYRIPDVADADLTSGAEVAGTNLAAGTITRITRTPASFLPVAGTTTISASSADDNRFPAVNDDASIVAFVSSRNITNVNSRSNADLNAEIFVYNRTANSFSQLTQTANPANSAINLVFSANPSLSGDGQTIAFFSTADFAISPAEATADKGNGEIYIANFNGTDISNLRQVTRTPTDTTTGSTINAFSFGRRLSRNGQFLLFETRAELNANGTTNGALTNFLAIYLYNVAANTLTKVGPRATSGFGDVLRFPTFTGDSSTIVFASALNFRADGTAPTSDTDGLNAGTGPNDRRTQIFSSPVASPNSFTRLTNVPLANFISDTAPFPSETTRRIAFSYRTELGGGNSEAGGNLAEAFYMLVPPATSETPAPAPSPVAASPLSFFTGASVRPVATPLPSPNPDDAVTGLAPGMLAIARATTVTLAPSDRQVSQNNAQENLRRPPLPIELNGVSVAIGNAAAGLYFVGMNQINFVVPVGLRASDLAYPVVVNNNGAVIRGSLVVKAAQPDLLTTTNGPGGRAIVFNVTNPLAATPEPPDGFPVTTERPKADGSGNETVPTELLIMLTGVRNVLPGQVTVVINGAKQASLSGTAIVSVGPSRTSGFDQIIVRLPPELAGAGDSTIVVQTIVGGQIATSRPEATAPRIRIK
jgi:uncharacterized protein (TIGR03437 family)